MDAFGGGTLCSLDTASYSLGWGGAIGAARSRIFLSQIVASDADEQLLISIAFKAKVKVHSIAIKAPADGRAPKSLKLFVNKPSMDCSDGESMVRAHEFPSRMLNPHAQEFPSPRWEVADVLAPTRACTTAANASVNYRWRIRRLN
jgi:hypothetical protein